MKSILLRDVAQRIKVTLGIIDWSSPRAHINEKVWHLDVGSSPLGAVVCSKGGTVRDTLEFNGLQ